MTPSELAVSLARIFAARDAQAGVSIDDAWGLCVHRGQHSVSVRLSPDQRTLDAAVAAVRAAGQWGWALASPLAASREQRTSSTPVGYDERTTVVTFAEAP